MNGLIRLAVEDQSEPHNMPRHAQVLLMGAHIHGSEKGEGGEGGEGGEEGKGGEEGEEGEEGEDTDYGFLGFIKGYHEDTSRLSRRYWIRVPISIWLLNGQHPASLRGSDRPQEYRRAAVRKPP